MAIQTDPKGHAELKKIVSRRLRAARRSVGLSEQDAARELLHKGLTQVSLAESGGRIPPLLDLCKYADLYCTSVDFLAGRVNDPLAEEEELGQALIVRAIGQVISGHFEKFSNALSEQAAVSIAGHRVDRSELIQAVEISKEALEALKRMRELNPEYEDLRGGANLEKALAKLSSIGERVEDRIRDEMRQRELIDCALEIEKLDKEVHQFALALKT